MEEIRVAPILLLLSLLFFPTQNDHVLLGTGSMMPIPSCSSRHYKAGFHSWLGLVAATKRATVPFLPLPTHVVMRRDSNRFLRPPTSLLTSFRTVGAAQPCPHWLARSI
ncbi:hypothetical protein B0T09DRAFT_82241 [Sordaria sp. MPI-SDFR-AT-0083]|nr:hypothetical protein B0T09DRAFT_82241 [Sordaria sp. MPI-SDFR-AT-0083]